MTHLEFSRVPVPSYIGAAIGAGASLVGAYLNASRGGQDTYASQQFAREQMNFAKRETDTVHQREVEDLKAAGLNPALSGMGGGGNPAATGAPGASFENRPPVAMPNIYEAFSLANEAKRLELEQARTAADIAKSGSEKDWIDVKRRLEGKGILKSLDNEGGEVLRKIFDMFKNNPRRSVPMRGIQPGSEPGSMRIMG